MWLLWRALALWMLLKRLARGANLLVWLVLAAGVGLILLSCALVGYYITRIR